MLFPDHRHELSMPQNFVSWPPGKQFLLDKQQLIPCGILEGKLMAEAKRPAIDDKGIITRLIRDREVIAPGKDLLLHQVSHQAIISRQSAVRQFAKSVAD